MKRFFKIFFAWNYEKEEKYLDKKSEEGWQLVKGGCLCTTYEKDTTSKYGHRIDYNGKMIVDSEEKRDYIAFFAEQGWEYRNTTFNGWSYFRKKYKEGLTEEDYAIYTDKTSLGEMYARWIKLARVLQIVLLLFSVLYIGLLFYLTDLILVLNVALFILLFLWIQRGVLSLKRKLK